MLLLAGSFGLSPVADGRDVAMDAAGRYWCLPGRVCSWTEGYCPRPFTDVIVKNMASRTYGNIHFDVTATRLGSATSRSSPVRLYIQWVNPLDRPLLIRGPWLGAYGTCVR